MKKSLVNESVNSYIRLNEDAKLEKLEDRLKEMNKMKVPRGKDAQQDFFDEKAQLEEDIKKLNESLDDMYDNEGNPTNDWDREEYQTDDRGIDSDYYWEEVANAMGGTLESFELSEYGRLIIIQDVKEASATSGMVEIKHDWDHDGTEGKPWTYVNGDDRYGRLAIWEEDPTSYAEDIIDIIRG